MTALSSLKQPLLSVVCMFVFSGLRGAVAFALVLHLQLDDEKRHVLITSTLIIIMFTILCLGGSTLPLLKVTWCLLTLHWCTLFWNFLLSLLNLTTAVMFVSQDYKMHFYVIVCLYVLCEYFSSCKVLNEFVKTKMNVDSTKLIN